METKHGIVAAALRREIERGELRGELPSEAELQQRFGFARGTIRTALTTLENEGLVHSFQGSRRMVRKQHQWTWPMSTWERNHSSAEDAWASSVREQGGEPSTEVTVTVVSATREVAQALGVNEGDKVVARTRIRSVSGEPHQLADSYFPYWLAEQHSIFLAPGDLHAPGGLLAAAGLPQVRFHDQMTARMPTPDEARALHIASGTPLLIHSRIGYDKKDRALRYMVTRMASDRVNVTWDLTP